MHSKDALKQFLSKFSLLTDEEADQFCSPFSEMRVKKRQYIVQPGFTAKSRHYVVQGAFRAFIVGDSGSEHTITLAVEDWWITDYNSYIYQQPATMFVVALEESIILHIEFQHEQQLKKANPKFETIFRIMAERGLAFQQRLLISNLLLTAEERYDIFISQYPKIAHRVPQYVLASFLGMTTEFLSKIRNKKVRKKS